VNNNKKYIQFLSGILLEGKSATIINKIGLSKYLADDMESRYGKYAIWVADSYRKYITKLLVDKVIEFDDEGYLEKQEIDNLFKSKDEDFQTFISGLWQSKYRDELYGFVFDWLRGRNSGAVVETDKLDFKNMTAIQAYTRAADWHRKLETAQAGEIMDEHGNIIMTFPDGYYWIDLESSKCDDEAKAMNHCGMGSSRGSKLYSLRKDKKPSVTIELMDGTIRQIRGRANSKPKKEYHKYILDFILSDLVKDFDYDKYKMGNNFFVTDLESEKDIDNIISKKPLLMKNQDLSKLGEEQVKSVAEKMPRAIPLSEFVEGELTEENIKKQIQSLLSKSSLNSYSLGRIIKAFHSSGDYFANMLIEEIKDKDIIFDIIKKNAEEIDDDNIKKIIKVFYNSMPNIKSYLKDLLLKRPDVPKLFMSPMKNFLKYISIIALTSIFDKDGLQLAQKFLANPKIKSNLEKEVGKEYVNSMISVIADELK
tara:strand:+ start:1054 stop:2496 length:1443 start_codon:yes stop_codon:yes gene_type:complete